MNVIDNELKTLCLAAGCAGQKDIVNVATELLKPLVDEIECDALGNILAIRHANKSDAQTVMIEAHLDEIGFMVTDVDDNGFVFVAPAGGVDKRVLATQSVVVYGKEIYTGVFCSTPPHLRSKEESLPEITDIAIDVGLDAQTARANIPIGSRVGFAPQYTHLTDSVVTSKGLDDRSGMAAVLHCLRQLTDRRLRVVVSFCVQEELGCRGAAVAARKLAPDYALVTDVSFALTKDAEPRLCGKRAGGVMVGISPILDDAIGEQLMMLANERNIPYQTEVMAETTGTDVDMISVCNGGIPCGLLSIPLRYMHTPVETVDLADVKVVGDLMAAWISWKGAASDE